MLTGRFEAIESLYNIKQISPSFQCLKIASSKYSHITTLRSFVVFFAMKSSASK